MCKKTKDGYKLESGRLIKYDELDFSILSPDEFKEIIEEKASLVEVITIKQDINKILVGIEDIKKTHIETKKEIALHTNNCPIQKSVVYNMIDDKINTLKVSLENTEELKRTIEYVYWTDLKNKFLSGSKIIKAGMVFAVLLLALGIASGFLQNLEIIMKMVK